MGLLRSLGNYLIFLSAMFRNRESFRVYPPLVVNEMMLIGINSVFIVMVISVFIGAVTAVQTAYNLVSPLVPKYTIGVIVRDMAVLELSTTFTCVVLAGKVGSNIAGSLGSMRVSEQIDALEVMGINSVSYLVLPKIIAGVMMFPLLVAFSAFLIFIGGYIGGVLPGLLTESDYIYGIRFQFEPFNITFALIKGFVFGFLITSISSFQGYNTRGGSLEVGKSSTEAVTNSCIALLLADYFLAQILL